MKPHMLRQGSTRGRYKRQCSKDKGIFHKFQVGAGFQVICLTMFLNVPSQKMTYHKKPYTEKYSLEQSDLYILQCSQKVHEIYKNIQSGNKWTLEPSDVILNYMFCKNCTFTNVIRHFIKSFIINQKLQMCIYSRF